MIHSSRRRAFTLVELLVVIGIIAVLIAILLPALSRAREQSKRVQCLSNLRQLGYAMLGYINDNKGWFPAAGAGTNPDDWIFWESGRVGIRDQGALVKYLGSNFFVPAHYICPSDNVDGHPTYPYSYTMNEAMGGWQTANNPNDPTALHARIKITQVKRSSEKILMIDESSQTIDDGCWAPQHYAGDGHNLLSNRHDKNAEKSSDPHAGSGNSLFADSHAEFTERWHTLDPLWWDPFQ